mgnify:CR=1 FL=1|tara:strand:+ start:87 stop:665 length:579 start_codon:yes stop_codon:yes gene_type:complete
MPIVLNGSTGVITGIPVGGLPDGIVDTDMIANNAVTSAKATGIAGGKILQVVADGSMITNGNTEMAVEANSGTGNVILVDAVITPSATSSKVLVYWTIEAASTGGSSNSYGGGYLKRGTVGYNATTSGDTLLDFANGLGTATYFSHNLTKFYYDSPNTTDAREYTILLNRWSSGTTKVVARRWLLVLLEIAA